MSIIRRVAGIKNLKTWDNLMTITAIVTMFVFLLRSGEALATGPEQDMGKVLTSDMIAFRRKVKQVIGDEILTVDEMILLVGKAKADQLCC
jgi:ubiquitin-protein ligase